MTRHFSSHRLAKAFSASLSLRERAGASEPRTELSFRPVGEATPLTPGPSPRGRGEEDRLTSPTDRRKKMCQSTRVPPGRHAPRRLRPPRRVGCNIARSNAHSAPDSHEDHHVTVTSAIGPSHRGAPGARDRARPGRCSTRTRRRRPARRRRRVAAERWDVPAERRRVAAERRHGPTGDADQSAGDGRREPAVPRHWDGPTGERQPSLPQQRPKTRRRRQPPGWRSRQRRRKSADHTPGTGRRQSARNR